MKLKMPVRKNYKTDKSFENAMLKYMIKLEPEMYGIRQTEREKMSKGGMTKKYAMGGMMEEKKINPSTGMAMNKGGMSTGIKKAKPVGYSKGGMNDMRKTGMFYGGGMAKARSRGK
jgi:hypothetical protein